MEWLPIIWIKIAWITTALVLLLGVIGTFLPLLPGPWIILGGGVLHYFWVGKENSPSWKILFIITSLFLLTQIIELLTGIWGTRRFGGTKWGMLGMILGGIVGIFFGLPGLIIGPIAGTFLAEFLIAQKNMAESSRATQGSIIGMLLGTFLKGAVGAGMVGFFYWGIFFAK